MGITVLFLSLFKFTFPEVVSIQVKCNGEYIQDVGTFLERMMSILYIPFYPICCHVGLPDVLCSDV